MKRLCFLSLFLIAGCGQYASYRLYESAERDLMELKAQYEILLKDRNFPAGTLTQHAALIEKAMLARDRAIETLRQEQEKSRAFWATTLSVTASIMIALGAALVAL